MQQKARLSLKTLWKMYQEGQELLQARRFEDAGQIFQKVAGARLRSRPLPAAEPPVPRLMPARNPLYVQASLGLSYCCVERGNLEEAMTVLREILAVEPENADAHCELGYVYSMKGRRGEALDSFHSAIDHNPNCAKAHKALGYLYLQEDRVDE